MNFRFSLIVIIVFLCLSNTFGQDLSKNVLEINDIPIKNQYSGQLSLYGNLLELNTQLKAYSTEDDGNYSIEKFKISINNSQGSILLFDQLVLREGEYAEIINDRNEIDFIRPNEISIKKKFNSGPVKGKELELHIHRLLKYPQVYTKIASVVIFEDSDYDGFFSVEKSFKGYGASDNCNLNIICPEGDVISDESRAVARIMLVVEEGTGWCSGALMNNTSEDYTPYFLTAFHCQDGYTPIFDQWRFDFDYQYSTCGGQLDEPQSNSITGCVMRAGRRQSDFMLLEFMQSVPANYDVYYNGWNNIDQAASILRMAHHPMGDVKKVTVYGQTEAIKSHDFAINWTNQVTTPASHHWYGSHDSGMFEVGSSGASALDQNNRVVGQNHGGVIDCLDGFSYFGKLSRSWADGATPDLRLKEWLDPMASNNTLLDGIDGPELKYCDGRTEYDQFTGNITDGSGNNDYLANTTCEHLITLSDMDYSIQIDFNYVLLDNDDSIVIYDGNTTSATVLAVLDGSIVQPALINSTGHEVLIRFVSNDVNENQGFDLDYSSEEIERFVKVGGKIETVAMNPVDFAMVYLYNTSNTIIDSINTDTEGNYNFDVPSDKGVYFIEAEIRESGRYTGISLLDKIQMIRSMLEILPFSQPNQYVAADIDENGELNLLDLIYVKMITNGRADLWPSNAHDWFLYIENSINYSSEEILSRLLDEETSRYRVDVEIPPAAGLNSFNYFAIKKGDINLSR